MQSNTMQKVKKNISSGLVYKLISLFLPFAIRTIILWFLGAQYVGLNSLFKSIIQVLNLAELGFSSAIIYSMYKPISEGNDEKVSALLNYYRKIYIVVGVIILTMGVLLSPWLTYLINGTWPEDINIYVIYFIFLFNTCISYFLFGYQTALLNAYQRVDVSNKIQSIIFVLQYIIQLILLVLFKNYYIYIIISPISTIVCNLLCAYYSKKLFPNIRCFGKLDFEDKKKIRKQVIGLMIGKLSDTSRNSLDSIILSSLLGLTVVAIYSNYYYIYSALYGLLLAITHSIQPTIGNTIAKESVEKNYSLFRSITLIFQWIAGFCTVCLFCLYQPFMKLWVGEELMLSFLNMSLFCLYFYLINMNNTKNLYFTGNGMWWQGKYSFVIEAVSNLLLNLILGYYLGVTGILLATVLTIFIFNFMFRLKILFKEYFKKSMSHYLLEHLYYLIVTVLICGIMYYISTIIAINNLIIYMIVLLILCIFISNVLFFVCYCKTKPFKELVLFLKTKKK